MDQKLLEISQALSDKQRLRLFKIIVEESALCNLEYDDKPYRGNCASFLVEKLDLSMSTLSHHIKLLEQADLIKRIRKGRWEHFFPNYEELDEIIKLIEQIKSLQKIKIELHMTHTASAKFKDDTFEELTSLLENHEFKRIHLTKRQHSYVAYLQHQQDKENTFILIFNPQTKIITLNVQTQGPKKNDEKHVKELNILIEKYLPTIADKMLVLDDIV